MYRRVGVTRLRRTLSVEKLAPSSRLLGREHIVCHPPLQQRCIKPALVPISSSSSSFHFIVRSRSSCLLPHIPEPSFPSRVAPWLLSTVIVLFRASPTTMTSTTTLNGGQVAIDEPIETINDDVSHSLPSLRNVTHELYSIDNPKRNPVQAQRAHSPGHADRDPAPDSQGCHR